MKIPKLALALMAVTSAFAVVPSAQAHHHHSHSAARLCAGGGSWYPPPCGPAFSPACGPAFCPPVSCFPVAAPCPPIVCERSWPAIAAPACAPVPPPFFWGWHRHHRRVAIISPYPWF